MWWLQPPGGKFWHRSKKHIEELLSWAGNKITAVLQKELPETLQPLLSKMEDNFSAFSSDFVDEISDFSGQLIYIIGDSVRAGYLDINALSTALTELKVHVQGAFDKLLKSMKGYDISIFSTLSKAFANETRCFENITFEINKSMSEVSKIIHGSILKNVLSSLEKNKQGKFRTPLGIMACV
ncbi:hypothetical protein [Yokenella regensburgei]|uniref:hypothetical protein n=1 Tax=Yokenella regensburgei TaxID=158877 RepID=UPI001375F616|nr:hypothetical protein [Yokenella regensburgei]KAF1366409.1 hypothetical protein FHR25_005119 [Yokenella regensburgei]